MSDTVQFFEGVEKYLKIFFKPNEHTGKVQDLRKIPRGELQDLLNIVKCEIMSSSQNDHLDSYVLSESSMFISNRRFILKTCGSTTPLLCLKTLMMLAKKYAGFTEVENLFYSRKNYKRPDLQIAPHHSFQEEVALLNSYFSGSSHRYGDSNGECWYLYTLQNPAPLGNVHVTKPPFEKDQTLEILMTDLDPDVMSIFTKEESSDGKQATKRSGIDKIIPEMEIDEYLFEPWGYSMNGHTKMGCYMTIHITPEPEFSYVSFETNYPCDSYKDLITRVVDTFQPGNFSVTVFSNEVTPSKNPAQKKHFPEAIRHGNQRSITEVNFTNYDFVYTFYSKFPS